MQSNLRLTFSVANDGRNSWFTFVARCSTHSRTLSWRVECNTKMLKKKKYRSSGAFRYSSAVFSAVSIFLEIHPTVLQLQSAQFLSRFGLFTATSDHALYPSPSSLTQHPGFVDVGFMVRKSTRWVCWYTFDDLTSYVHDFPHSHQARVLLHPATSPGCHMRLTCTYSWGRSLARLCGRWRCCFL